MLVNLFKQISQREKLFVFLIILVISLIVLYPTLVGRRAVGSQYYFFGSSFVDEPDYPVYLSLIEQSRQGFWLFENLYTTESQARIFFSPLWLLLGKLNWLFGLSNIFWFYLAKILAGMGFLYFLYFFVSKFFTSVISRLTALVLLGFSSGLGILILPSERVWDIYTVFYKVPVDFWVAESNTFLSIYHSALFSLSQLLLVAVFYYFLTPLTRQRGIILAFLVLLLGVLHPYDLITLGAVPLVYLLSGFFRRRKFDWPKVKIYLIILIFATLAGGYYLVITYFDLTMSHWAARNWTPSPPIFSYLIGYGLVLALAIFGSILVVKNKREKFYFIISWAVTSGLLLYLPSTLQRRFSSGLHIALVILAVVALGEIGKRLQRRELILFLVAAALGAGLFLSNITLLAEDNYNYVNHKFPHILSRNYYLGTQWLRDNSALGQAILSTVENGNILPALTGRKVYAGHGHQTINFSEKEAIIKNWFFRTNGDDENKFYFLQSNNLDFIWYSAKERKLGSFEPASKSYLEKVYGNEAVEIYRVKDQF